jgi:predicted secreted hydrolase
MKLIFILIGLLFFACTEKKIEIGKETNIPVSKAMGNFESTGFAKAVDPINFNFPADHGPHEKFKTEWWYFTGNLTTADSKKFGYQFTIFRTALAPYNVRSSSRWKSNQMYMGHFAVSDIDNDEFYFDEKFSRNGNNLAGATIENIFNVWIEDWEIIQVGDSIFFDLPKLKIISEMENVKINLMLKALKPRILQGDNGLSQKGIEIGNASYYYSYTRLETKGTITLNKDKYEVNGNSWMDREWSTSALGKDQVGWDWFALQLNHNTDLMYYQMRKIDGTADNFSKGVIVDSLGNKISYGKEDVILKVNDYWTSPLGTKYPSGWLLEIPKRNLSLTIKPALKNQFMDVAVKYWEGSVNVSGITNGKIILGSGYVELTAY